jgi:hypothetical protein
MSGKLADKNTTQEDVMKKIVLIGLVMIATLTSCAQKASKVSNENAKEFVSEATYTKDNRTGMCYAVVASKTSFINPQQGMSFTWVPCEQAEKFINK